MTELKIISDIINKKNILFVSLQYDTLNGD